MDLVRRETFLLAELGDLLEEEVVSEETRDGSVDEVVHVVSVGLRVTDRFLRREETRGKGRSKSAMILELARPLQKEQRRRVEVLPRLLPFLREKETSTAAQLTSKKSANAGFSLFSLSIFHFAIG